MKTIIDSIEVVTADGEIPNWMSVGSGGITLIKDLSAEFETGVYSSYTGYDEKGNKVQMFENCPVIVNYRQVPDEDSDE